MYVSRGGIKLEHALKEFRIDVAGKTCLDIGASTGGFTDCLLQHGATKVYAVDVGYGILAWKLRKDPRVVVVERTNARYLDKSRVMPCLPAGRGHVSTVTMDVSFISLSKIFPAVYNLLEDHGEVVALIKPQFEAKREEVERGGIVRDEAVRKRVVEKVKKEAETAGFTVKGTTPSPIEGADGNVEYFLFLERG